MSEIIIALKGMGYETIEGVKNTGRCGRCCFKVLGLGMEYKCHFWGFMLHEMKATHCYTAFKRPSHKRSVIRDLETARKIVKAHE